MESFLQVSLSHATSISQSKWPTLQMMESSFIFMKCSEVMIPLHPVDVTKICPLEAASSMVTTSYPVKQRTHKWINSAFSRIGQVSVQAKWPIRPALISGFCSMKQLGAFLLPPRWDASTSQGYPPVLNFLIPISIPGWREALWEWNFTQEHNSMSLAGAPTRMH